MGRESPFDHPYDTPLTSGLRFLAEIIEWAACAWVAAGVSLWLVIPVLVVLIGLPTVFSTPGDKRQTIVATPGVLRVLLELTVHVVGVICAWVVLPAWLAAVATIVVIAAVAAGVPRTKWLLQGAPTVKN